MISAENLVFSYKKNKVLDGLSFSVDGGECLVFTGPNGSGKSTALAIAAGILTPDAGTVKSDGKIGYLPQSIALFTDMTVLANLRFFAKLAGKELGKVLPLGLDELKDTRVSKLSGGQKKRLSIACTLISEPDILLLDEPCSGLDKEWQERFLNIVREKKRQGCAVIYVGHNPEEYSGFADRILDFKVMNVNDTEIQEGE